MCKHLNLNCPSTAKTTSLGISHFPDVMYQVYIFHKVCNPTTTCYAAGKAFMFDSEHTKLMSVADDYPLYVSLLNQLVAEPVVLFFITNENVQTGLRFVTEEDALEAYLKIPDYKTLIDNPLLQSNKK